MKLKQEEKKYTNQIIRLGEKKKKLVNKIDTQVGTIRKKRFKIELRLSHLRQLTENNCHHKKEHGRKQWRNMRDDASFSTYVACKKCGKVLYDECYGPRGGY